MATIAEIVAQSGNGFDDNSQDFDILLSAVETAGLTPNLSAADADLTVFAPTDEAFIQLAQDFGFEGSDEAGALDTIVAALSDLGDGDPIPILTDVLLYHISPGVKTLETVQSEPTITTLLEGATLMPDGNSLVDNEPDLTDPSFVAGATDIEASNGIIQAIDRVLIPLDIPGNEPTIAEIVVQSGGDFDSNDQDFDILLNALEATDLIGAVNDPTANLTVFAPTDAAFVRLAQDLGFRGVDEAGAFDAIANALTELGDGDPIPLLTDILLYHVSPEARSQAELQADGSVDTLLTDASFTLDGNTLVDNEPDLLNPTFEEGIADIEAANGIIQGIDRVLIPLDIPNNNTRLITGSSRSDFLFGLLNNTTFLGGSGNDFILGGIGDDQLNGENGNDRLFGNLGSDILRGGEGDDTLFGGSGSDLLLGGLGSDRLFGERGDDALLGGAGADQLYGGRGNNILDGGLADDHLYLEGGINTVVLRQGDGTDTINGFQLEQTTFSLADGLTFGALEFQQRQGFSEVIVGDQVLARVVETSVANLSLETNYVMV
ncbi:MAG: fasciclin domain-containing protein [Cyanobacteria bacterium P01_H01_bin.21]